jgi:hypothetical protein
MFWREAGVTVLTARKFRNGHHPTFLAAFSREKEKGFARIKWYAS